MEYLNSVRDLSPLESTRKYIGIKKKLCILEETARKRKREKRRKNMSLCWRAMGIP